MNTLLAFSRRVDWITEKIGKSIGWLLLAAVLISAGNAVIRKAFGVSSNAYLEAQWYLFGAVFMLGAGYVFLHDQHVRIDVLSNRFSRRGQIWVDVLGIVLFLLPPCVFVVWTSLPSLQLAITTKEVSANPGGLLRWPVYALVPLGFAMLAVQAMSELIKRVAYLTGHGPDPHAKPEKTDEEILLEELRLEEEAKAAATTASLANKGAAA